MGITQQLEQCHSLGMNVQQPQHMTSQMGIPQSNNLLYQTSPTNPFQTTRCKLNYFKISLKIYYILGPNPDASNVAGWTNYPVVPVTVNSKKN
jgi:hypothetical protein